MAENIVILLCVAAFILAILYARWHTKKQVTGQPEAGKATRVQTRHVSGKREGGG